MNKTLALIAAAALALPLAANAQTTAPAKPAAKAAAKPAAKPTTTAAKKRQVTPRAAKAVEEVTPIDTSTDVTLNEADLAVAQRVYTGKIQCELGADVTITADDKKAGFFTVSTKGAR